MNLRPESEVKCHQCLNVGGNVKVQKANIQTANVRMKFACSPHVNHTSLHIKSQNIRHTKNGRLHAWLVFCVVLNSFCCSLYIFVSLSSHAMVIMFCYSSQEFGSVKSEVKHLFCSSLNMWALSVLFMATATIMLLCVQRFISPLCLQVYWNVRKQDSFTFLFLSVINEIDLMNGRN